MRGIVCYVGSQQGFFPNDGILKSSSEKAFGYHEGFLLPAALNTSTTCEILNSMYRKKCWIRSKTLDSLMAWLGEKRKTEFS